VTSLSLAPDGWSLLSAGRDKVVHVWDLRKNTKVVTIPVYEALEGKAYLQLHAQHLIYMRTYTMSLEAYTMSICLLTDNVKAEHAQTSSSPWRSLTDAKICLQQAASGFILLLPCILSCSSVACLDCSRVAKQLHQNKLLCMCRRCCHSLGSSLPRHSS